MEWKVWIGKASIKASRLMDAPILNLQRDLAIEVTQKAISIRFRDCKYQYKYSLGKKTSRSFNFTRNTFLPEEYIGELQASQRRWIKKGLSEKEIKFKTLISIFSMFKAYIECRFQNIWLEKNLS